MTIELKEVNWIADGNVDLSLIIDNIITVRDALDEVDRLRRSLAENVEAIYPCGVSCVIEARGDYTALPKAFRSEIRVSQAFVLAGTDVHDGQDTKIELLKNGTTPICDPIILKATEGRGKVVPGEVAAHNVITRFDTIVVRADTDRRIVVNMNFEAV